MDRKNICRSCALRIDVLIAILTLLMMAEAAGAATLTVNASGGAMYTTIQAAINAANTGDTIEVTSGVYSEYVNINKQLILIGKDMGGGKPIIDNGKIVLNTNGIIFEGFKIMNSLRGWPEAGILIYSNDNIIRNNVVMNSPYGGILLYTFSNNNTIFGNDASLNGEMGIELWSSNNNKIENNVVNSNPSYGIYMYNSYNNNLINNTANMNNQGGAIQLEHSINNTISGNTVKSNNWGINLVYQDDQSNTIINNKVENNSNTGILLQGSGNTILNNIIINNSNYGIYMRSSDNTVYNNRFNNANNIYLHPQFSGSNYWNITKTPSINIMGGFYLGGNFWANPSGTGFSQTCADVNKDSICDSIYTLSAGNVDHLPLSAVTPEFGYITGIVYNSTGIAGAIVTTNTNNITSTDASSTYSLVVPAGTYNLTVTKEPEYYSNTSVVVTAISGTTVVQDIELLKKLTGNITGIVSIV
ncbi:MAG: NosD domain-containing protein [Candidatus Methanoperedens sp.]